MSGGHANGTRQRHAGRNKPGLPQTTFKGLGGWCSDRIVYVFRRALTGEQAVDIEPQRVALTLDAARGRMGARPHLLSIPGGSGFAGRLVQSLLASMNVGQPRRRLAHSSVAVPVPREYGYLMVEISRRQAHRWG